jgi:hypothetical protein
MPTEVLRAPAMKRGGSAREGGSLGADNMPGVVQAMAGMGLGASVHRSAQCPDQTAALQLGHFATKSVLGSHVFAAPRGGCMKNSMRSFLDLGA